LVEHWFDNGTMMGHLVLAQNLTPLVLLHG
jgi:hypothetical protein